MTGSFLDSFDGIDDSDDWIFDDADDDESDADEIIQLIDDEQDDSKEGQT